MAESERQTGAQAERDAIRKWIARKHKTAESLTGTPFRAGMLTVLNEIDIYLNGRTKRYNARPGGLSGKGSRQTKG